MTKQQAMKLTAVLVAAFPTAKWDARTVEAYASFLSDLDFAATGSAIDRLTKTSEFPPSIAKIRLEVAEDTLALPSSFEAWEQFSVRDPGRHELVRRVERTLGGYHAYTSSDAPGVFRSQFLKLYEDARAGALVYAQAGRTPLPAATAPAQITKGSHDEEPTDEERAKLLALMKATTESLRSG